MSNKPTCRPFRFSGYIGSALEVLCLDLETVLLDFAYFSARVQYVLYLIRLASWHFGIAQGSGGFLLPSIFDQHSSIRVLRAFQVGCGDSEDGPDMPVLMKPGLGPGEQLTT